MNAVASESILTPLFFTQFTAKIKIIHTVPQGVLERMPHTVNNFKVV